MKKVLAVFAIIIALVVFVGCGPAPAEDAGAGTGVADGTAVEKGESPTVITALMYAGI